MGTGPGAGQSGFDLALTELAGDGGHRFVVEVGSQRGADMLARVPSEAAMEDVVQRARSEVNAAADRMGRQLDAGGVVRSSNHAWVWSFELRPVNGHTRLISRNRFDTAALPMRDKPAYPIIEPGSWVMERKMLLTIKQRAEQLARQQIAG